MGKVRKGLCGAAIVIATLAACVGGSARLHALPGSAVVHSTVALLTWDGPPPPPPSQ